MSVLRAILIAILFVGWVAAVCAVTILPLGHVVGLNWAAALTAALAMILIAVLMK